MSAEKNIALIQNIYAAFGRGDVPAILEHVSEDVDWGIESQTSAAPWLGTGRGRAVVAKFFETLAKEAEFSRFEPSGFLASDDAVCCLIGYDSTLRKNGRKQTMNGIHHFTIKNGRITKWRGWEDTAYTAANWNA